MKGIYATLILLLLAMLLLLAFAADIPRDTLFWIIEALGVAAIAFLVVFYRKVVRPMRVLTSGMQLLREQDFSSRLRQVGERRTDEVVGVFNRMMEQLREGRLELRERTRLLDLLVDVSPMGVVMLDFDGRITSLNPAARQFLATTDESLGKTLADIPSDLARKAATLQDGQTSTFTLSDSHVYRTARRSFIDRGFARPFILIESLTDVTMQAERDAYGKVIRMISHEANNTLGAIGSILEMVDEALATQSDSADLRQALAACQQRSSDMSAFVTRFADVVKIPDPVLRPVPVGDIVLANQQFLESLCTVHAIGFSTTLCPDNPTVQADAALLSQVLVNMVKNSIESILAKGSGTVSISTQAGADGHAVLEVADTGAGLSEEVQHHLFTPFFTTKAAGHGIGLLLIREILTRHRCRFSLRTGDDGVTRFRIAF